MSDRRAAGALTVLAGWAIAAPFADGPLGLAVATAPSVEFVDHVLPGMAAMVAAMVLMTSTRAKLPAALGALLAGFWMTATHLPLLVPSLRSGRQAAAAVWHTAPGACVLLVAVALVVQALRVDGHGAT